MELRRARASDLPAIVGLVDAVAAVSAASVSSAVEDLAVWQARFEREQDRYPWLIAEVGGAFAGFAKASAYGTRDGYDWCTELTIYLAQHARGQGIAKPLYGTLIDLLTRQGYRQAWAKISADNPASERLHTHFGLRKIGVQTRFAWKFDQWWDIGLWQGPLGVDDDRPPARPLSVSVVWTPTV